MTVLFPHPPGMGGPGSFQIRMESNLRDRGWQIGYAKDDIHPDIILVVGGTRKLLWLIKMKWAGIPVILRLDGIPWLHRHQPFQVVRFVSAELRKALIQVIHSFLADGVIYQSEFARSWWSRAGWKKPDHFWVIHNGVDTEIFQPEPAWNPEIMLLAVEGTIDYSPYAVDLLNDLATRLTDTMSITLYGRFEQKSSLSRLSPKVNYRGRVERKQLPHIYKQAIYLSLDIHPACPNAVIEALASGIPVVAFDTGSLKELVPPEAGILVDYGSDPWQLGQPDIKGMEQAIRKVAEQWAIYSQGARRVAVDRFDVEQIMDRYIGVFEKIRAGRQ